MITLMSRVQAKRTEQIAPEGRERVSSSNPAAPDPRPIILWAEMLAEGQSVEEALSSGSTLAPNSNYLP